jgi:hypothetical protein
MKEKESNNKKTTYLLLSLLQHRVGVGSGVAHHLPQALHVDLASLVGLQLHDGTTVAVTLLTTAFKRGR